MAPADQNLVQRALAKKRVHKEPTHLEARALRVWQAEQEEKQRWQFYATIPKKHWVTMSGQQNATLNKLAGKYGLPVGGPTIDLAAVARWIRDTLAKHGARMLADESDPMFGPASPALEEYRRERAKIARLDREEREGSLLPLGKVHGFLTDLAGRIRNASETIERIHGQGAAEPILDAIDDAVRRFAETVGPAAAGDDPAGVCEPDKNGRDRPHA